MQRCTQTPGTSRKNISWQELAGIRQRTSFLTHNRRFPSCSMVETKLFIASQKAISYFNVYNENCYPDKIHYFIDIIQIFVSILWYILCEINISPSRTVCTVVYFFLNTKTNINYAYNCTHCEM